MIVGLITGAPGCQKTRTMITESLLPARYLFAVPRIVLIEECSDFICSEAQRLGLPIPEMRAAHAEIKGRGNVQRQIDDAAAELANAKHAIVFVTHEGLRISDLSSYAGWHVRIDEMPDSLFSGSFSATAVYQLLDQHFHLDPIGDGKWWRVVPRAGAPAPNMKALMNDAAMRSFVTFYKQARTPQGVLVNIGDWQQARTGEVKWWSLWTPLSLENFETVAITAAGYEASLCYQASIHWFSDRLTFEPRLIGAGKRQAYPMVRIHYFTQGHSGSTAFWGQTEGRWCLNKIADYFKSIGGIGFWSGNDLVQVYLDHRFPGQKVLPKLAGTNALIEKTSCALIYSNKAQQADEAIIEVFGLNREQIQQAREFEDVFQFVMRGAIRRPDYGGDYDVYLYDIWQARALERYLREGRITDHVTLIPVEEAGILDEERPSSAKTKHIGEADLRTEAERQASIRKTNNERKQRSRDKQRIEKAAAGKLRPPGRPRKSPPLLPSGN